MTNSTRVFTVTKIGCAASTVHVTSFLFEIAEGDTVDLIGKSGDGIERAVRGFRAVRYDVPPGSCAGYYPECNPLLPLWHHAERSHVPAGKSIPINIRKISRHTAGRESG